SRARLRGTLHGMDGRRARPTSGLHRVAGRQAPTRRAARGRGSSRLISLAHARGTLDFDRDAPEAGLGGHACHVVSLRFGGAGDVAGSLSVVEEEVDLLA